MTQRTLTALRIGNFKAFADTQRIPLKPITLIFGPNSAGKSSFIQSLALAHEAQFGRDKRGMSRLDVHHTDVGGRSIDLGGFRQYVHRGQTSKRVEWGAELDVAGLDAHPLNLLGNAKQISLTFTIGIELDDQERPVAGAQPRVEAVEIAADGEELLHMSHRRSDENGAILRLDRLAVKHQLFQAIIVAIIQSYTTTQNVTVEDMEGSAETIAGLLPELQVRIEQFFPSALELPQKESSRSLTEGLLIPVSKGNRREDIAQALRAAFPGLLSEFVTGLSKAFAEELKQLQYLGPLRSFPPRHLAFAEHEDSNWYAGGGYAWDMVRRNDTVRAAVNDWLGSDKLKTPYELEVRTLVPLDVISAPLASELENLDAEQDELEPDEDSGGFWVRDRDTDAQRIVSKLKEVSPDSVSELSLLDKRSNTRVSHRDVGIGISQVLPVLVAAYGSRGKLLAMEQPEIHLHPALQAELGDVFIESAFGERQNTFILETHSEHLILRLLRRIREGKIRSDDIAVFYVDPLARGSRFTELRIDDEGDFIDEWPGGFFEEAFHEKFAGR